MPKKKSPQTAKKTASLNYRAGSSSQVQNTLSSLTKKVLDGLGKSTEFTHSLEKCSPEEKKEILLTHGSLLVMHDPLQQHWLHQIPVRKRVNKPRIKESDA